MTVKQMRKLLRGLPGNMQVIMPLDEDTFVTVCAENSAVVELDDSEEDEIGERMEVLLLVGCSCESKSEYEVEGLNTQPELN